MSGETAASGEGGRVSGMDEHVITVTPEGPHYFRVACSCEYLGMSVPVSGWQELGIVIMGHLAPQKVDSGEVTP